MIVFEDPEADFQFEKIKQNDASVRWKILFFILVFLSFILFIIKNNFNLNLGTDREFELVCGPGNSYSSADDAELKEEKARKALKANEAVLVKSSNYAYGKVIKEPIGYNKSLKEVIAIGFYDFSSSTKKIPKEICGFQTKLIYVPLK